MLGMFPVGSVSGWQIPLELCLLILRDDMACSKDQRIETSGRDQQSGEPHPLIQGSSKTM